MRLIRLLIAALAVAVSVAAVATAPAGAKTKPKQSITVSPNALLIGDTATVTARGFKARSQFVLRVNGAKVAAGTTNRRGRARLDFTIPAGSLHELNFKLSCAGKIASATLTVIDGETNFNGNDGSPGDSGDIGSENGDNPEDSDQVPELTF